jgi:hypothetical protein
MPKKSSNKERIQKMADEAAAAKKEKAEKKKTTKKKITTAKKTKKKTSRKKTTTEGKRLKMVWKVFDANYKEVACFAYPDKNKAYKKADDLTQKNNKTHFVNAVTVPMEED